MRGGWSGFGMATVGIHPNDFDLDPNKIPTGGVVQNCQKNYRLFIRCFEMTIYQQKGGCGEEKKMNQGSPIQLMTDRGGLHFLSHPPIPIHSITTCCGCVL